MGEASAELVAVKVGYNFLDALNGSFPEVPAVRGEAHAAESLMEQGAATEGVGGQGPVAEQSREAEVPGAVGGIGDGR